MKLKHKIRQYGPLAFVSRSIKYFLRIINIEFESWLILAHNIDSSIDIDKFKIDKKFYVRKLKYVDFLESGMFSQKKLKTFFRRFNSSGYLAYGIFSKKELAYYCWISLDKFEFSENLYEYNIQQNQGLLFDAYCFPNFRRNNLHNYMNNFRLHLIKKYKKKIALVVVLSENKPALRSQFKNGFHIMNKVFTYNIFGFKGNITYK